MSDRTSSQIRRTPLRSLAGQRLTTEEVLAMRRRRLIGTIPADVGPRGAE